MLFVQHPSPFFSAYSSSGPLFNPRRRGSPTSSQEECYRHIADEHHRYARAALGLAQQERERAARQRQLQQIQAAREARARVEQEALARERQFAGYVSDQVALRHPAFHHAAFPFFAVPSEVAQRRAAMEEHRRRQEVFGRHEQDARRQAQEENPLVDFLAQLLASLQREGPADDSKKQVRFQSSRPQAQRQEQQPTQARQDVKGKGKAPQQDTEPAVASWQAQPQEDKEGEDFISHVLHALRAGESDELLKQMGVLPSERASTSAPVAGLSRSAVPNKPSSSPAATGVQAAPSSPHGQSFTSIDTIQTKFTTLKSSFEFPSTLDFEQSSSFAKLPFNATNAPVHAYESELIKLLTKLDAIDSDGAESVRGARRALVLAIGRELDWLDARKEERWKRVKAEPEKEKEKEVITENEDENETERATGYVVKDFEVETPRATPAPLAAEPVKVAAATVPAKQIVSTVSAAEGAADIVTPTPDSALPCEEAKEQEPAAAAPDVDYDSASAFVNAAPESDSVVDVPAVGSEVLTTITTAATSDEDVVLTGPPAEDASVLPEGDNASTSENSTPSPSTVGEAAQEFDVVSDPDLASSSETELVDAEDSDEEIRRRPRVDGKKQSPAEEEHDGFEML